jgi:hypothetical protein
VGNVEVYRCFAGNYVYDPCWADSAGGVMCMESPWAPSIVHLAAPRIPPGVDVATTDLDAPWGVQLTSGARCVAVQGAHDKFAGKFIDFGCSGGPVRGLALLRGVNRSNRYWTYQTVIYKGSTVVAGPTAAVATAWYAGPSPTSAVPCQGQFLGVSSTVVTPRAGWAWLVFRNLSPGPCRLYGYPGVAVLYTSGHQILQVARSPLGPGSTVRDVVIPHEGEASALLEGDPNYPNETCPTYQALAVTPPNTTATRTVSVGNLAICANAQINPVSAGGAPLPG